MPPVNYASKAQIIRDFPGSALVTYRRLCFLRWLIEHGKVSG